jgi:hypothetical protein
MLHTQYENVRSTDSKQRKDSPHTIILYMLMHVRCMIIQTLPQNNRTNPCPNMNWSNEKQSIEIKRQKLRTAQLVHQNQMMGCSYV